jgi:hypothetical protein
MKRVLVTASREWTDVATLERVLTEIASKWGVFILVQGDNPNGGDAIAKAWAIRNDFPHEDVPADWDRPCDAACAHRPRERGGEPYCPRAGNLRNQVMVDRGAHLCVGFPMPSSRGTLDCMRRAKAAHIPVSVFHPEQVSI